MDRGKLCVTVLIFLCYVQLGDFVLRMCTQCRCTSIDNQINIDCTYQQLNERYLQQIQDNQNGSVVSVNFSNNNLTVVKAGLNTRGVLNLDYSNNLIQNLTHLNDYKELLQLNLAYNKVENFESEILELLSLKRLNMSNCLLKDLQGFKNNYLPELSFLDLSGNKIEVFDAEMLGDMTNLSYLDLSWNLIKKLDVSGLEKLQVLSAESNAIGSKFGFPHTLLELNVQNNSISELFMFENTNETKSSLELLYLNQNKLTTFLNISLPFLRILNISNNELKTLPGEINFKNCPNLEELILSQNKFEHFEFTEKLKLMSLKVNGINKIRKLNNNMFKMLENYPESCMNISFTNNLNLDFVYSDTFKHLNICYMDLGNNGLKRLPKIETNSGSLPTVKYGVNFQYNPVICDCQAKWILEDYITFYYKNHKFENLLTELRCTEPEYFKHYRLIHWYNWTDSIFCQDVDTILTRMKNPDDEHFGKIFFRSSGTMILVLSISIVFLATLFIIGLGLAKRTAMKRSRWNRRY